jgi:gliding motility-associated-like protein
VGQYGVDISFNESQTICIGDTARLTVVNLSGDPLQYEWSPAAAIISGANTASILVSPSMSTDFLLRVSNNFGCELDTTLRVNLFNFVPPLEASAEPDTLLAGESSQLLATENSQYNYLWVPSATLNGNTLSDPVATPPETTTYKVTIRDNNGCINSALVTIVVLNPICREPNIFVPNGFSPNGDGLNDILYVRGNAIENMFFVIYDRWGEKVFESRSPDMGWDGTFRGKMLAPDAYGYYLEVLCINGERFLKKGNITLLR